MWWIFGGRGQQHRPRVDKVSPDSGPVAGGIQVRLTGRDFNGASAVRFGQADATFQLVSDAEILVPSLPHSAVSGPVDVVVTAAGSSTPAGNRCFKYLAQPVIDSVAPSADSRHVKDPRFVQIRGKHLVDVQAVYFGTEPARSYRWCEEDGSIEARRRRGKAGPTTVTVVTPGGKSAPAMVSFAADWVRAFVVVISAVYMLMLIAGLLIYINWPTFPAHVPAKLGPMPLAVPWFGALGAVLLSISGLVDHFGDWDSSFLAWHLLRPVIGAVMGSVGTLVVISGVIASTGNKDLGTPISQTVLYDLVGFLIGYREETFRTLIKRFTDVVIGPGGGPPGGDGGNAPPPAPPAGPAVPGPGPANRAPVYSGPR